MYSYPRIDGLGVEERLRSLWRAKGNVALVDLSHGYFVIRFNQEEDMMDEGLDRGYQGK